MGSGAREAGECAYQGGGGVQGDQEEARGRHEGLSQKPSCQRKEILGRESPDKLDKPSTFYASTHRPAVLALST